MAGAPKHTTTILKEGKANTHLTHLEELVLTQGAEGFAMAKSFLLELLKTLKGGSDSHIQTSVKWDGAPAIFAGINPENGKFFVGTKSIFNKVPKINYTEEDIINNHGHAPGLVDKLVKALKYLPSLGIRKILQGDFMFDDEMLDVVEIDGEPHYRFKPNTIVYAVPVESDLGQEIGQSKFGIVFHTTYDSLVSGASFGADVSNLNRVPGIWFDDAFFTDDTGTVTLTTDEEKRVISLVKEANAVNEQIDYNNLPSALLNIYINSEIKTGRFLEDPRTSFEGFKNWISERQEKRISKLKSEKGRLRATAQGQQNLQLLNDKKEDILNLFRISRLLFEAKNVFIEKYNNAVYNTKHFVDDGSGNLVASNPEGYVAVDHQGRGIKFVDRLEFSRANFMIDKSAKFTNESSNLTINVSKNVKITKTLCEWANEIKKANHILGTVPSSVYKELINGGLVVETVQQEEAQETIYNTVQTYINNILKEEAELEVVDITNPDPEPTVASGRSLAIVPGAFKPPHRGHLEMVKEYATHNDHVMVLVSNPLKSQRTLADGTVITSRHAKEMWDALTDGIDNVEVIVSSAASPMTAAYEFIGEEGPLNPGDVVTLGASSKGGDWRRWTGAEKYVKSGVEFRDPQSTAVEPTVHSPEYIGMLKDSPLAADMPSVKGGKKDPKQFHASDMRYLLGLAGKNEEAIELLGDYVADNADIMDFLSILGIDSNNVDAPLEEMSAMGAGAVGGYSGPLGSTSGKPAKKKKKKTKTENIDMSLVNEVFALLIERGNLL